MKTILLTGALLLGGVACGATPLNLPEFAAAKEQAKEQNKPVVVLWHWTRDIGKDGETTAKAWSKIAQAGLPALIAQYDESVLTDKDERKTGMPIAQYNLPAALIVAADGTFVASLDRDTTMHADKALAAIKATLPKVGAFMQLVQQARQAKGVDAARAAGQALDQLRLQDAMQHPELRNIINRQDPQDESGYRALYGLDHLGMYAELKKILQGGPDGKRSGADRDFDAADAYVDKALAHKELKGERRQQWLCAKAYILRERINSQPGDYESKDYKPLVKLYEQIVSVAPKTEFAIGAKKLAEYWDKDVFFTLKDGFYDQRFQCKHNKEWHVDISKDMSGAKPGTYSFSLVPRQDSAMISRNFRLMVNGNQVDAVATAPKDNTKTVEFNLKSAVPDKAKVEVWITTRCLDGWMGPSGNFVIRKK
ncbi:MAG: hypothetical protein ACI4PZ_01305 [Akkermansia sp.]